METMNVSLKVPFPGANLSLGFQLVALILYRASLESSASRSKLMANTPAFNKKEFFFWGVGLSNGRQWWDLDDLQYSNGCERLLSSADL